MTDENTNKEKSMENTQDTTGTIGPAGSGFSSSGPIARLAAALAKAQAKIRMALKGSVNPGFKSRYADLASVVDACREPLAENGIAVMQPATADGAKVTVTTILVHSSGEWISAWMTVTAEKATAQGIGSCVTYIRRYGLASLVGVAPDDDDDGNAASGRDDDRSHREPPRTMAPAAVPAPAPNGLGAQFAADAAQTKNPKEWEQTLRIYLGRCRTKADCIDVGRAAKLAQDDPAREIIDARIREVTTQASGAAA